MNVFLIALQKRLANDEITLDLYNELAEELKEPVVEPVEVIVVPTELELLKEANLKLTQRLYDAEQVASDNSQSQQELLELLIEMGVI